MIFFDIDHTLFDTDMYLESGFDRLNQMFSDLPLKNPTAIFVEIYENMRGVEVFHPKRFAHLVVEKLHLQKKKQSIIDVLEDQTLLDACIYSEVHDVFQSLAKQGVRIGIFSTGDKNLQQRKIYSLREFLNQKDIHIYPLKDKEISKVLKLYKNEKITFVDDRMQVLEEIFQHDSSLSTILIKRKKPTRDHPASNGFQPAQKINSLKKLPNIVR